MADRYGPTKTQKKDAKTAGAVTGTVYGGMAGTAVGASVYGHPSTPDRTGGSGRYQYRMQGRPAKGAYKWQESAKAQTKERPNPKFNTKRWEKINNLHQRAGTPGEKAAAGAAKERMLAGGEGPHIPGSKNPFLRAMAHEHSPKVAAGAAAAGIAGLVGTGLYHGTKKLAESGYRHDNQIAAERKEAMSKSAFGVDHEEVAKAYWNPTTKTRKENVKHGAKKGAKVGAAADATFGALRGGAAMGPKGALIGAAGGAVEGAVIGGGIGATHGALRPNRFSKSMDLKPLVFGSNGNIVGGWKGNGEQRDPKGGPFGVPKGPEVKLGQRPRTNTLDASTDLKPSGVQGRGKGKRDQQQGGVQGNKIAKAFTEPLSDEELAEIYKGLGAAMKSVGGAAKSFGIGAANRGVGAYGMAKPKIGAGLKLATANPGKTALATAGVGGAAGFGIGRKSS